MASTRGLALLAGVLAWLAYPGGAQAQVPVSVELVLAVDSSLSVDDREFDLPMTGIAEAFRAPEIIDLIGQQDGVAVALFQWSGEPSRSHLIPWHLLTDAASARAFAAEVQRAVREPQREYTGIGKAVAYGVELLTGNRFDGRALKIDISGDGRDNIGSLPSKARDYEAFARAFRRKLHREIAPQVVQRPPEPSQVRRAETKVD